MLNSSKMEMAMQYNAFFAAFMAGLAAPTALYAAAPNYLAFIPGPNESFAQISMFLNAAMEAQTAELPNGTKVTHEQNVHSAAQPTA